VEGERGGKGSVKESVECKGKYVGKGKVWRERESVEGKGNV